MTKEVRQLLRAAKLALSVVHDHAEFSKHPFERRVATQLRNAIARVDKKPRKARR